MTDTIKINDVMKAILCSISNILILLMGHTYIDNIVGKIVFGLGSLMSILSWTIVMKHTNIYTSTGEEVK